MFGIRWEVWVWGMGYEVGDYGVFGIHKVGGVGMGYGIWDMRWGMGVGYMYMYEV